MAKYLAPDGYLYDANSGLYYTQTVETDVAGNRTQNVLWFNAETGEYTRAQYKLPPVPPAPPAPAAQSSTETSTNTSTPSRPAQSAPAKFPAKKKNSWLPAIIAGVAVVLLGGGAFFALKNFGYEIQDKLPFMESVVSFANGNVHQGPLGGNHNDKDEDRDDDRNDREDNDQNQNTSSADSLTPVSNARWDDYSIDSSELKISVVSYDTSKIDSLTIYGVGDLDREFPCTTGTDSDVIGDMIYMWGAGIGDVKVALYYKYEGDSGSITPREMSAGVIGSDGSLISSLNTEIKNGTITFYDISLPSETSGVESTGNVSAVLKVGGNTFKNDNVPLLINGKLANGTAADAENFERVLEEALSEGADGYGHDGVSTEEMTEEGLLQTTDGKDIIAGTFVPDSEYSPEGNYIGFIFGNYVVTPDSDFDKEFFETDGYPSIHIFTDGTYEMFCQIGGDSWVNKGYYSVSEPRSEMDDVTVYLYGAKDNGGNTVTAEFVFTDAQDYPLLVTEGMGYMGAGGSPYWFERDY